MKNTLLVPTLLCDGKLPGESPECSLERLMCNFMWTEDRGQRTEDRGQRTD